MVADLLLFWPTGLSAHVPPSDTGLPRLGRSPQAANPGVSMFLVTDARRDFSADSTSPVLARFHWMFAFISPARTDWSSAGPVEKVADGRGYQKIYKEGNQQQVAAHRHRWDWACTPWWQVRTTQPGLCTRLGAPGSTTPPYIPRAQGSQHRGCKIQATTAFSGCLFKLLQMF